MKKMLLPVNNISLYVINTHGTVSSRQGRDTPDGIYLGDASDFENAKARAKQRLQIHKIPRLPE